MPTPTEETPAGERPPEGLSRALDPEPASAGGEVSPGSQPQAPPEPDAAASRRDLDRSLVRGIAWSGVARWTSQIVSWASTLVVARLLTREDYGLVGMALIYHGLASLLNHFGFSATVVTLRELTSRQLAELNLVALGLGTVFLLLSFAAAPLMALFFDTPALVPVILVMSSVHVIAALRTIPAALLERDLRFRRLALIEAGKALLQAAAMVAMAVAGFGYWTLVLGLVVGEGFWTLLVLLSRRVGLARPARESIGAAIRFGRDVLVAQVAWYVYSNADFAIAGKLLGKKDLGAYSMAWTLASLPVQKITNLVRSVTSSLFSAVQSKDAELRRYVVHLTEGLSIVAFPAGIGMALVADPFIPLVLGEEWRAAVLPLEILALYAVIQSVFPLIPQILVVRRQTRYVMWLNLLSMIILPAGFLAASHGGTGGIAAVWVTLYPCLLLAYYVRAFSLIGMRAARYLGALWPAASASAAMVGAVIAVKLGPGPFASGWPGLGAQIAAGAISYTLVLLLFHRSRVAGVRRVVGLLRG